MKPSPPAVTRRRATPATTAAERAGIAFAVHEYAHNPAATSFGLEAAAALGLDPARVYKTLIARVDGAALVVAIVPVAARLNLKALAAASGGRKAELAEQADAERATGYVVGGISPLGQRKRLPAVVDASALRCPTVYVSAGRRGLELELVPADLISLTGATTAPIAQ